MVSLSKCPYLATCKKAKKKTCFILNTLSVYGKRVIQHIQPRGYTQIRPFQLNKIIPTLALEGYIPIPCNKVFPIFYFYGPFVHNIYQTLEELAQDRQVVLNEDIFIKRLVSLLLLSDEELAQKSTTDLEKLLEELKRKRIVEISPKVKVAIYRIGKNRYQMKIPPSIWFEPDRSLEVRPNDLEIVKIEYIEPYEKMYLEDIKTLGRTPRWNQKFRYKPGVSRSSGPLSVLAHSYRVTRLTKFLVTVECKYGLMNLRSTSVNWDRVLSNALGLAIDHDAGELGIEIISPLKTREDVKREEQLLEERLSGLPEAVANAYRKSWFLFENINSYQFWHSFEDSENSVEMILAVLIVKISDLFSALLETEYLINDKNVKMAKVCILLLLEDINRCVGHILGRRSTFKLIGLKVFLKAFENLYEDVYNRSVRRVVEIVEIVEKMKEGDITNEILWELVQKVAPKDIVMVYDNVKMVLEAKNSLKPYMLSRKLAKLRIEKLG